MALSLGLAIGGQGKPREYAEMYRAKHKGQEDAIAKKKAANDKEFATIREQASRLLGSKNFLPVDEKPIDDAFSRLVITASEEAMNETPNRARVDQVLKDLYDQVNIGNMNYNTFTKVAADTEDKNGIFASDREIAGTERDPEKMNQRLMQEGNGGYVWQNGRLIAQPFAYVPGSKLMQDFVTNNKERIFTEVEPGKGRIVNENQIEYMGIPPEMKESFVTQALSAQNYRGARADFYRENQGVGKMAMGSPEEKAAIKANLEGQFDSFTNQFFQDNKYRPAAKYNFNNTTNINDGPLEAPGGINETPERIQAYSKMSEGMTTTVMASMPVPKTVSLTTVPAGLRNQDTGELISSSGGSLASGVIGIYPVIKSKYSGSPINVKVNNNGKEGNLQLHPGMVIPDNYLDEAYRQGIIEMKPMISGQFTETGKGATGAVNVVMPLTSSMAPIFYAQTEKNKPRFEAALKDLQTRLEEEQAKAPEERKRALEAGNTFTEIFQVDQSKRQMKGTKDNNPKAAGAPPKDAPAPAKTGDFVSYQKAGGGLGYIAWKKAGKPAK